MARKIKKTARKGYMNTCKRCGRRWASAYQEAHCPACAAIEASEWGKCRACHKNVKRIYASNRGECPICRAKREAAEKKAGQKQFNDVRLNQIVRRIAAFSKELRPLTVNSAPHYLTSKEKLEWVGKHRPEWNAGQVRIKQEIERLKRELK